MSESTDHLRFIAMSPNVWAKGEDVEDAKDALKEFGGTLTQYIVRELPEGAIKAYVNGLGEICWTWAEGADTTAQPVTVAQRGIKE